MVPGLPAWLARWVERTFRRSVDAVAEGLFPSEAGLPGAGETDLARRTAAYVEALPPTQRPLLVLLFLATEWLTVVLAPLGGPMSARPPARRLAIVEGWRASWIWPVRLLGDAVRATMCMVYFSHPAVLATFGEPPDGAPTVSGVAVSGPVGGGAP